MRFGATSCRPITSTDNSSQIQLPHYGIAIVFIDDRDLSGLYLAPVNRYPHQQHNDPQEEETGSQDVGTHPLFKTLHRKGINREAVQVGASKKSQVRLRREVRAGKRHFVELKKETLNQENRNGKTKRQLKHSFARFQENEFQRSQSHIQRNDSA